MVCRGLVTLSLSFVLLFVSISSVLASEEEDKHDEKLLSHKVMYVLEALQLKDEANDEAKSIIELKQGIAVLSNMIISVNGENWHQVTVYEGDKEIEGWIKEEKLSEQKPEDMTTYADIRNNELVEKVTDLASEIWAHNSLVNVIDQYNQHINQLEEMDVDIHSFLDINPLIIKLVNLEDLPSDAIDKRGRYLVYPGVIEIGVPMGNSNIPQELIIHEFGHHIGYKAAHGGDANEPGDFTGFSQHRELDSLELGRNDIDWENRNQEKFAESYTEVFVDDHQNRSSTGNFENNEKKMSFFEWVKDEIHLRIPGNEGDEDQILYAKDHIELREEANNESPVIKEVKRGLAVLSTETQTINGETWHLVTAFDQVHIIKGWVQADFLSKTEIEDITTEATIEIDLPISGLRDQVWAHNSKINVIDQFNQHIEDLEMKGFNIRKFLEVYPLVIRVKELSTLPGGGRYLIYPGILEISVPRGNSHITEQIVIHEFSHHIGYKVIHGGDASKPGDFSGLSQHRDLKSLEMGRSNLPWAERNQEIFAESYSELFLSNYSNRSITGNFETEEAAEAFFEWVKEEVHAVLPSEAEKDYKLVYAKENIDIKEEASDRSTTLTEVKNGYAVILQDTKTVNHETWHYVTAYEPAEIITAIQGWVKADQVSEVKPEELTTLVEIQHRLNSFGLLDEVWIHNAQRSMAERFNEHIDELKARGFPAEEFLEKYPLIFRVLDKNDLPLGSRYILSHVNPGVAEISVPRGYHEIDPAYLAHEFSHQIGFKVIHGGDAQNPGDFTGFDEFRDLENLDLGRAPTPLWERNQEIFAESYVEVFVEDHVNRSITGNFENDEIKEAFFEWVKLRVIEDLGISGDEDDNDQVVYAKETIELKNDANTTSKTVANISKGYAMISKEIKAVNGEIWHFVTAYNPTEIEGWVKNDQISEDKLDEVLTIVDIEHRLEGDDLVEKAWIHNALLSVVEQLNEHFEQLRDRNFPVDEFLDEYPLIVRILDRQDLPLGSRYILSNINPGVVELSVPKNNYLIDVADLVHEFSHHIGFKSVHKGDAIRPGDFSGFDQFRELNSLELGRPSETPWEERNQEIFAESYTEVFVEGHVNKSMTGNFESDGVKEAFFEWVKQRVIEDLGIIEKDGLESLVEVARAFNEADYTANSFERLVAALNHAESILTDDNATQDEVDQALANLQEAIDGLIESGGETPTDPIDPKGPEDPGVDLTELEELVESMLNLSDDHYTADSFARLVAALSQAETILSDDNATQDEVDHGLDLLNNAIDNLVKIEDKIIVDDQSESKKRLPKTATNTFLYILFGSLLIISGVTFSWIRKVLNQ